MLAWRLGPDGGGRVAYFARVRYGFSCFRRGEEEHPISIEAVGSAASTPDVAEQGHHGGMMRCDGGVKEGRIGAHEETIPPAWELAH